MRIEQSNIIAFIRFLYQERTGEEPPQELLDSWSNLSDQEINEHLSVLFERWGYSQDEAAQEVQRFLATQPGGSLPPSEPAVPLNPEPLPPPAPQPPSYEAATTIYSQPPYHPPRPPYSQPQIPVAPPPHTAPPPKRTGTWIIVSILLLLALIGAWIGFQYAKYNGLKRVFTITDNVAIRKEDGSVVGRMDVYGNPAKNSFSSLRALDNEEYPLVVGDKEYAFRKVLADSATFSDYLLHKGTSTYYVSAGYLTEKQSDHQRYRDVFRTINNNAKESSRLTAAYRRVIIGSLDAGRNTDLYLANPCNNQSNDLTSVWKYQAPGSKVRVAAAKMSDGQYYLFSGNTETDVYDAPQPLYFTASSQGAQPLQNRDVLFRQDGGKVYLYDCSGANTNFYAVPDSEGKIQTFNWTYDPTTTQ